MVNEFSDFADRQSDTMYLIISHGRNYVYGWTSSGKKKLVQTPMRLPELMNTAERVSKYPYIKVIEKWDVKAIKNYEYDLDNGPSHGKFFPDMLFRVVYNKNRMSINRIYVNMDSIYLDRGYFELLGIYEIHRWGIISETNISRE